MSEWPLAKLSELGEVNRGRSRHRPRDAAHLYGGPYPFIQTGDIKASGGRITQYTQTYSEDGLAQSRLWPSGTMCITIAANIAETGILSFPSCFPDSVIGFIADESKADVRFIEYAFRLLKRGLQHEATGTVQDNINLQTIERLQIPVPSLVEQRAIAHILGTLDDKIELNRRMNKTLEAMARAIFKSWFVDFDPVRAKASDEPPESICHRLGLTPDLLALFPDSFQDSELGEVPKGWEVASLDSVLVLQRGFDLPAPDRRPGAYPILAASGPSGTHHEFMARGPGVTTGRSGVLGKVFYVHDDYWPLNTSLWVKEFKHAKPAYAFHLLQGLDFRGLNAGSAVPTLNRNHAHMLRVLKPSPALIDSFEAFGLTALVRQRACLEQSDTLISLRDALLPQLLSGELRATDAREALAAVA